MKRLFVIIGASFFLICTVIKAEATDDVVKVGYLPLVMSLPTFVAEEKGFFKDHGLKVELTRFQSGTTIIDALMAGRIDANCGSATTGHWFAEQNVAGRFKIFLVYGTDSLTDNTFVVVVKKDAPIKELKDLKGKKVAHFPGATSLALARAIMHTQMDPEDITFMEVPPPNLIPALAAGQIDAFFAPEPFGLLAVSKGIGNYLMKSPTVFLNFTKGYPGGAFSFSSQFLKESPEQGEKVKTAIQKAMAYIKTDEEEARKCLAKYTQLPPTVAMRIPFDKWIMAKDLDKQAAQDYFEILFKEGAYKNRLDTTQLYYE